MNLNCMGKDRKVVNRLTQNESNAYAQPYKRPLTA